MEWKLKVASQKTETIVILLLRRNTKIKQNVAGRLRVGVEVRGEVALEKRLKFGRHVQNTISRAYVLRAYYIEHSPSVFNYSSRTWSTTEPKNKNKPQRVQE